MATSSSDDNVVLNELVEKINQFLTHQLENNSNLSEAAKESLTIANECIEQAYKIQRKAGSPELFDLYKRHTTQQQPNQATFSSATLPNIGASLVQNLANTILTQATASASARSTNVGAEASEGAAGNAANQPPPDGSNPMGQPRGFFAMAQEIFGPAVAGMSEATAPAGTPNQSTESATTTTTSEQSATQRPPKTRKKASEAEKLAAESFKNQGNDLMKQDKYQEAMDCYSQAISIDDNNAIFYSNRAAAKSKLGDHQGALADCQEAIEIDSTYSKAYGRMGLAYASLEDHRNAKEAYMKAVELDPTNQSYRNNLLIAEEKLGESANQGQVPGPGRGGNDMMSMLNSLMSNPQVMQMAMRSLQDPRMQNLFSNLGANMGGGGGGAGGNPGSGGNNNNGQPPNDHYS